MSSRSWFSIVRRFCQKSAGGHEPEIALSRDESSFNFRLHKILPQPLFRVLARSVMYELAEYGRSEILNNSVILKADVLSSAVLDGKNGPEMHFRFAFFLRFQGGPPRISRDITNM